MHEKGVIVFASGPYKMALELANVREVLEEQSLYPIPFAPEELAGVLNLRGAAVTVADLGYVLGQGKNTKPEESHILVADVENYQLGLLVDHVESAGRPAESEIVDLDDFTGRHEFLGNPFRLRGEMVERLDMAKLVERLHESARAA